jgi:DNA-binding MarR family transcriptional regulator
MAGAAKLSPIQGFVGSAHLFSSALTDVLQTRLLQESGGKSLSVANLKLLQLLAIARTQTVGDLAAFLGVSNAAASKMVERLVQAGWLSRSAGITDRRSADVALTAQAERLLAQYQRRRRQKLAKVFGGASHAQLRALTKLMDTITVRIVNHSARAENICLHCGIYFRDKCLVRDLGGKDCFYRQRAEAKTSTRPDRRLTGKAPARKKRTA